MNKKEMIAYLAGIVDGEGYVGIKKNKRPKNCKSPTYHERIQIRMVEEKVIKLFQKTFGGNYYHENEHSKYSKKPLYCYQASDLIAYKICKILLPYLVIKKENAELILQLRKSKNNPKAKFRRPKMSQDILDEREKLYLACKKNNH